MSRKKTAHSIFASYTELLPVELNGADYIKEN